MEHAPSPPPKLELILEIQGPRQVPTGPTQPQPGTVHCEHRAKTCEHMGWGDLTNEAADLKMTPKGHTEPQGLANEEPCTMRQWLESLWEQATRPWVRFHTSGHGNVLPKVRFSGIWEVGLLGPQVRKPQAKDHKPAKRNGINTTTKENFVLSKSSEDGLE